MGQDMSQADSSPPPTAARPGRPSPQRRTHRTWHERSASTSARPTPSSPSSRAASPPSSRTPRASRTTPVRRRLRQERRGPGRRGRQAPGRHQRRPDHPLGQAPHGHRLDGRHRRQELHAAGDQRAHPAEAQARRGGLPRRDRHRRGDHRPGVLQRRPAPGHQGGRRDRRASTSCASSTSRPRPRWPTAWTRARRTQTILVFDLGGGTFDVSLLEIGEGVIEVKATSGDNHLGGDDWDQRIVDHLVNAVQERPRRRPVQGQDGACSGCARPPRRPRSSCPPRRRPRSTCRTSRRRDDGPLHLDEKLTRAEFQQMTADLLDRTKAPFQSVHQGRRHRGRRHRPRRARRRLDPDAGRRRPGQGADRRQGAQQGRQPGRGRRRRRRPAGRRAQGRGQGRPAARRHPAVARHRDQGRHDDQAHRAQHDDPDQALARSSRRPTTTSRRCRSRSSRASARWRRTTRRSACSS